MQKQKKTLRLILWGAIPGNGIKARLVNLKALDDLPIAGGVPKGLRVYLPDGYIVATFKNHG